MSSSIKAARETDVFNNGERTAHPCMRCLNRFMKSGIGSGDDFGCIFPVIRPSYNNALLWSSMKVDVPDRGSVQFLRCKACLAQGQDCFAPPDAEADTYRELEEAFRECKADTMTKTRPVSAARPGEPEETVEVEKTTVDRLQDRNAAKVIATRLFLGINSTVTPYPTYLSAHSGAISIHDNPRSGVILKARVRSKEGIMLKEAQKRKEQEAAARSGDSSVPSTPKKARFGAVGAKSGDSTFLMSAPPVAVGTGPNAAKDARDYARKVEQAYFNMDVAGQVAFEKVLGVPRSAETPTSPRRRH